MSFATAERGIGALPRPPVRIRTILAVTAIMAGAWWLYARGQAAWQLHAAAAALADYGLCMVGPTGPSLLRGNPDEFTRLVRRRLVGAAPNDRPFYDCADAVGELTASVQQQRAHMAAAWSFVEYGGHAADRTRASDSGELRLSDLRVTTRRLAELSAQAWPFVRHGYMRLVKPSATASAAVYAVATEAPALGSGLPNWRARYRAVRATDSGYLLAVGSSANLTVHETRDGGLHWKRVSVRPAVVSEFAERCPAGDSQSYAFGLSDDRGRLMVNSLGPDSEPSSAELASSDWSVFAAACDARGLVAALKADGHQEVKLRLCRYRRGCGDMSLPSFAGVGVRPRYPIDLARVDGVTVVAVPMHGIVRVTSTRDDGRTWTPYSVAFDRGAHPDVRADVPVPDRLLRLGSRLLLYGGTTVPNQSYPVLVSDNGGASWRSPR